MLQFCFLHPSSLLILSNIYQYWLNIIFSKFAFLSIRLVIKAKIIVCFLPPIHNLAICTFLLFLYYFLKIHRIEQHELLLSYLAIYSLLENVYKIE